MIDDFLNQTCSIVSVNGKDKFGKPLKLPPRDTNCRAKEKFKMVKNHAAQTVISEIEFWFSSYTNVKLDDFIQYNGKEYPIISIQIKRDTLGDISHKVVHV